MSKDKIIQNKISLSVKDLEVNIGETEILKHVDFSFEGDVSVGIVGESGSGKTMFTRSILGLLPRGSVVTGSYEISDESFPLDSKERKWAEIRGDKIGLIMQDPFTALDPLGKCGAQIVEGVPKNKRGHFDLNNALEEVGLRPEVAGMYPFELSGGMRQRVVIAAALATRPSILIADEATTALDVITQEEILDLLECLHKLRNMPLILITHDIRIVSERTERIVVMDKGEIVEAGLTAEVIADPKSEYTRALINADRVLTDSTFAKADVVREPLLKVEGLTKNFGTKVAVDNASIEIGIGECIGLVGESGSGKTTLSRCIVGLETPDGGRIDYLGERPPQIVFQDPYSSLNPAHTVRYILSEAIEVSKRNSHLIPTSSVIPAKAGISNRRNSEIETTLEEICELAEIDEAWLDRKAVNLSGGQRQRVAIARAIAPAPDLLICDESVSALDVVVQNSILATLQKLREQRGLAILFVTHDLSVVRMLADRVYVMKNSKIVESGETRELFREPKEPYTYELLAAAGIK